MNKTMQKLQEKLQKKLGYKDGEVFQEELCDGMYFSFQDGVLLYEDECLYIEDYLKNATIGIYYNYHGTRNMTPVDHDYLTELLEDGFGENHISIINRIPKATDEFWYIGNDSSNLAPVKFDNTLENANFLYLMLVAVGNCYWSAERAQMDIDHRYGVAHRLKLALGCD